jgi:hypothetical protein
MSCAPTTTVATPTMAAAAVPSAACAHHRLGIERPRLTVVIVFLQLLLLASAYVKAGHKPRIRLVGMLIAVPLP